jgi:hypothetical protein
MPKNFNSWDFYYWWNLKTNTLEPVSMMARQPTKSKLAKWHLAEMIINYECPMEQRTFKISKNCLNTNIYSYLETSGGQSYILYLNVVNFFNTSVRHLWQLRCLFSCIGV